MGKGLSELQKSILKMAYRNRGQRCECGDVKNRDVLIEVYKFPFHSPSADTSSGTPQIFKRQEIGISRYRSASVSVVKAFSRLVKRSLAIRKYNYGIVLTMAGAETAKIIAKDIKNARTN